MVRGGPHGERMRASGPVEREVRRSPACHAPDKEPGHVAKVPSALTGGALGNRF